MKILKIQLPSIESNCPSGSKTSRIFQNFHDFRDGTSTLSVDSSIVPLIQILNDAIRAQQPSFEQVQTMSENSDEPSVLEKTDCITKRYSSVVSAIEVAASFDCFFQLLTLMFSREICPF